jgi:hypothetical protein
MRHGRNEQFLLRRQPRAALGVVCLLFSAVEATIVFPLSRNVPARPEPWAAAVSISLIAAAIIACVVLLTVVGRSILPPSQFRLSCAAPVMMTKRPGFRMPRRRAHFLTR